jgi:hypothetical protein
LFITITNWEKYNPRTDVKHTTWFRLENTFWSDPAIYRLDSDGKMVWIGLLALASQQMSGHFELDCAFLASALRIDESKVVSAIASLKRSGKIDKHTSRKRHADVTAASRPRASYNEQYDKNESNETLRTTRGRRGLRCLTWEPTHRFAASFENLLAIPAYAAVFDVPHDEKILDGHIQRHSLTPDDLKNITWNYRQWVETLGGEPIRSPRGALASFAVSYAKEPASARKTQPAKSQLDELYPLITRKEDCY